MIPKIIHYCWFGGNPLPELAQKCIESWKKYCPSYEIKCWDESTFDLNYNDYVREAYDAKKWAFVTDVVRLYALVNEGGIYMDTDVEVLKPLDDLLQYEAVSGFESKTMIPTGLMSCIRGQELFSEFLHDYDDAHFIKADGTYDTTTNVIRITDICLKYGFVPNNTLQTIKGFTLLPKEYLCPKDALTLQINLTANTYTIHHFDGSWLNDEERYASDLKKKLLKLPVPKILSARLSRFVSICKFRGLKSALVETVDFVRRKRKR